MSECIRYKSRHSTKWSNKFDFLYILSQFCSMQPCSFFLFYCQRKKKKRRMLHSWEEIAQNVMIWTRDINFRFFCTRFLAPTIVPTYLLTMKNIFRILNSFLVLLMIRSHTNFSSEHWPKMWYHLFPIGKYVYHFSF